MTDQDKINAILTEIQLDSNAIIVLKLIISTTIVNISPNQLNSICQALGIATS